MTNEPRLIPARVARCEVTILNSRFIATIGPALTLQEAKDLLARVRAEYPDASHHVPAFIIGHGNSTLTHCHDDGEPSGTAGRPALAVLQGSGLGDAAVIVTRYFGGTKLGTGGLVRAYGDAVRAVLTILPRARKIAAHTIRIVIPYSAFEQSRRLLAAHRAVILDQEFGVEVTVRALVAVDEFAAVQNGLRDAFHGARQAEVVETNPATILPLGVDPA